MFYNFSEVNYTMKFLLVMEWILRGSTEDSYETVIEMILKVHFEMFRIYVVMFSRVL